MPSGLGHAVGGLETDSPGAISIPARRRRFSSTGALVAFSMWLGLAVGFVELGIFLGRVSFSQSGLYRKTPHVIWMLPLTDMVLFGVLGVLLAAVVRAFPRRGLVVSAFLLMTAGLATPLLAIPGFRAFSGVVLAGGLASWLAPAAAREQARWGRVACLSGPVLGVMLVASMLIAGWGEVSRIWKHGPPRGVAPAADAMNVLVLVMDTVRADATSLYGNPRDTTPRLRGLAARGARFDRAIASSSWTLPTHASLFTGQWPWALGVGPEVPLGPEALTLAEALAEKGYATAGFVANTSFCSAEYGLSRGFAHYEDFSITPLEAFRATAIGWLVCKRATPLLDRVFIWLGREPAHPLEFEFNRKTASEVHASTLRWIARSPDRPFFAFVNLFDAHDPYLAPVSAARSFGGPPATLADRRLLRNFFEKAPSAHTAAEIQAARDAYDDCLAYIDTEIGRFVDALEELGRLENTLIVVTSDHGEHFGEHGRGNNPLLGHRLSVYQQEVHVPLLVVAPKRIEAGTVVLDAVSLRDIPATILELIGLPEVGDSFPGAPLPGLRLERPGSSPALAEFDPARDLPANRSAFMAAPHERVTLLVEGDMALHHRGDGQDELYDLSTDPDELTDLAADPAQAATLKRLRESLQAERYGATP